MSEVGQKRCSDASEQVRTTLDRGIVRAPKHVRSVPIPEVAASFDYLVGAGKEHRRHVETDRLGCLEVDNGRIFGRSLKR
jgi:hypothetical protein